MKLFIFAVIGIIVILHILDQKPPTPTENGKKIEITAENNGPENVYIKEVSFYRS